MTDGITLSAPAGASRDQIRLTAQGLITETWERAGHGVNPNIMTDGVAYFMAVGLRAGDVVSNLTITIQVGGAALTLSKAALYSKAGVKLAESAELGAAWQSTGVKTAAMTAPYTVPADDGYYVCIIAKGSTLPRPSSGAVNMNEAKAVGSGMAPTGVQTGQTDLPSPATILSNTAAESSYWVGVS